MKASTIPSSPTRLIGHPILVAWLSLSLAPRQRGEGARRAGEGSSTGGATNQTVLKHSRDESDLSAQLITSISFATREGSIGVFYLRTLFLPNHPLTQR